MYSLLYLIFREINYFSLDLSYYRKHYIYGRKISHGAKDTPLSPMK